MVRALSVLAVLAGKNSAILKSLQGVISNKLLHGQKTSNILFKEKGISGARTKIR